MATYPEDEIEKEEHVFDAFRAAFHAHGVGFWRMFLKPVNEEVSRGSSRYVVLALTELQSPCELLLGFSRPKKTGNTQFPPP